MKILELFAGTRSISKEFKKRGHQTYSIEWDKHFKNITLYKDISKVSANEIIKICGGGSQMLFGQAPIVQHFQ